MENQYHKKTVLQSSTVSQRKFHKSVLKSVMYFFDSIKNNPNTTVAISITINDQQVVAGFNLWRWQTICMKSPFKFIKEFSQH